MKSLNEKVIQTSLDTIKKYGSLEQIPAVIARRSIYKKMGASENKMSSVESLYGFIQEKGRLPQISPLVNLYNAISVLYGIPMG
jgi:DNA/RNA-binding domain of Phe-tRNA-synthetase-like protein